MGWALLSASALVHCPLDFKVSPALSPPPLPRPSALQPPTPWGQGWGLTVQGE